MDDKDASAHCLADEPKKVGHLTHLEVYAVTSQEVPNEPTALSTKAASPVDGNDAEGSRNLLTLLRMLTPLQYLVFSAMFFGWALEAMDFYIAAITLSEVAATFEIPISQMAIATTVTLAMRPVGAVSFGIIADRFGRRIPLLVNVTICALVSLGSGFAPNFGVFVALRCIFGIAMGAEWALSAAMTMECLPPSVHGLFSGILHQAAPVGNIVASLLHLGVFPTLGWRPLYWISIAPAVFVILLRCFVPESPEWLRVRAEQKAAAAAAANPELAVDPPAGPPEKIADADIRHSLSKYDSVSLPTPVSEFDRQLGPRPSAESPSASASYGAALWSEVIQYRRTIVHMVCLISAFQFVSRGMGDMIPTILRVQFELPVGIVTAALISRDVGTMVGSTVAGYGSQYFGRKRVMLIAVTLALAFVPLFAIPKVGWQAILGSIFITIFIAGFNGVLAVFLHELGPQRNRALFMGFVTQLANLITGGTAQIEAAIAERWSRTAAGTLNFTAGTGIIMASFLVLTWILLWFCHETKAPTTKPAVGLPAEESSEATLPSVAAAKE
ncbi:Carboxylic acid transporter [Tieghemiomyces parasiticus]|uniref:Carboxylic acid transporter n=1 Tax=Tieghemiomyces parasiticus TaxID=78921 RepID=A0A9W8E0R9_9FUNG|nr:Carboxylic acid transporter [Tieghemiomyces parasiticus]